MGFLLRLQGTNVITLDEGRANAEAESASQLRQAAEGS
jgi:hypothetical protein